MVSLTKLTKYYQTHVDKHNAVQSLVLTLREITKQKDNELFRFWIKMLLDERKVLLDSLKTEDTQLDTIYLERIREIESKLNSMMIYFYYQMFKITLRFRKTESLLLPRVDKLRQIDYRRPNYWTMYES